MKLDLVNVGADGLPGGDYWEVRVAGDALWGIVAYPDGKLIIGTWNADGEWMLLEPVASATDEGDT